MNDNNYTVKTIEFPQKLYALAEKKAKSLGLTFDEYVNQILEKDVETFKEGADVKKKSSYKTNGKYFFAKDEDEMRRGL